MGKWQLRHIPKSASAAGYRDLRSPEDANSLGSSSTKTLVTSADLFVWLFGGQNEHGLWRGKIPTQKPDYTQNCGEGTIPLLVWHQAKQCNLQ